MDISPRSTLTSCGSSSMLVRRSSRPTRVTRGSALSLNIGVGELVEGDEIRQPRLGIAHHRPELEHLERPPAARRRGSGGRRSAAGIEQDREPCDEEERKHEHENDQCDEEVEDALERDSRARDVPGVVVEQRQVGDVRQMRRRAEHAARGRDDA